MLLIDDLLAAPFRGLMFILSEINNAVEAEQEADERRIMSALAGLNRRLDEGQITEAEFEADVRRVLAEASPDGTFSLRLPDNELKIWRVAR